MVRINITPVLNAMAAAKIAYKHAMFGSIDNPFDKYGVVNDDGSRSIPIYLDDPQMSRKLFAMRVAFADHKYGRRIRGIVELVRAFIINIISNCVSK